MADFLLGIDYGTGGAKTTIIDAQGKVLSYAFEEYPFITAHPGWSEHDPHRCRQIARDVSKNIHNHVKQDFSVSADLQTQTRIFTGQIILWNLWPS